VLETRPTPVEVGKAVERVVDAFPEHAADIAVTVPPEARVTSDPDHLEQILMNYLGNALKYGTSPYEVEAHVGPRWVEIRVRDHGQGVPEAFEDRLFEKFSQAPSARGTGTGLGLSIVKGLAEAQGGRAWYEANEPRGACFAVRLPAAR
jgi:signal transduction histidine kinase